MSASKPATPSGNLLNFYVGSRIASTTFDDAWLIGLPLFFATITTDAHVFGSVVFCAGVGEVVGFLLVPILTSRFRPQGIALKCDLFAMFAFFASAVCIWLGYFGVITGSILAFVTSLSASIWFANSDAFMSTLRSSADPIYLQRMLVLSNNTGSVLGPAIGGLLFSLVGLGGVAVLNAFSFGIQFVVLKRIAPHTSDWKPHGLNFFDSLAQNFTVFRDSIVFKWVALTSICVKISFMGIGFLILRAREMAFSPTLLGVMTSALGIGIAGGIFFLKPNERELLIKRYAFSTCCLPLCFGMACWFLLRMESVVMASLCLFFMGVSYSQYMVSARVLRQRLEREDTMPSLIASVGLLARLGLPLGGVILPFVFAGGSNNSASISVFVVVAVIWMFLVSLAMRRRVQ